MEGKKPVQIGVGSEILMHQPMISRRPLVLAAKAFMEATETNRPLYRCLR